MTSPAKLRRSMLFLPGANAAMLSTAFVYRPDSIMFDLEDAVSLREKDSADCWSSMRCNCPFTVTSRQSSVSIPCRLRSAGWTGSSRPRRRRRHPPAQDRHGRRRQELEAEVERIEGSCGREVGSTKLMAAIESASGVVNAVPIAMSSKRLIGVALAGFDYVIDMQTERGDGTELFYARCAVLHAARLAKIDAFDVVFSDLNDDEGFLKEVDLIRRLGFNGKSLINPRQIELLHNAFAPTQEEVDYAKRVVAAAAKAEKEGLGVVSLNGKMVDAPVVAHAQRVLQLEAASGVRK